MSEIKKHTLKTCKEAIQHVLCINALLMLFVGLIVWFNSDSELNFHILIPLLTIEIFLWIIYLWIRWKIKQYDKQEISFFEKFVVSVAAKIIEFVELMKGEGK